MEEDELEIFDDAVIPGETLVIAGVVVDSTQGMQTHPTLTKQMMIDEPEYVMHLIQSVFLVEMLTDFEQSFHH